jgi:large subunit ribosomal protein L21
MYAVIATGGKQLMVEEGDRVAVELLDAKSGDEVTLRPVLVVDGERVLAGRSELVGSEVRARVLGEVKGPKIVGFYYRAKTNNRRRFGHRQRYHEIEVTRISSGGEQARVHQAEGADV